MAQMVSQVLAPRVEIEPSVDQHFTTITKFTLIAPMPHCKVLLQAMNRNELVDLGVITRRERYEDVTLLYPGFFSTTNSSSLSTGWWVDTHMYILPEKRRDTNRYGTSTHSRYPKVTSDWRG